MSKVALAVYMAFAVPLAGPTPPNVTPCCVQCKGTGMVQVNDPNLGGNVKVWCNCPPTCACAANRPKPRGACTTGACPLPTRPQ